MEDLNITTREAKDDEARIIYSSLLKQEGKEAYTQDLVKELIKNKGVCLVTVKDNEILGALGARREGYKGYWLYFVTVKQKFRRKGVGEALMQAFFKKARKKGADKIASDTPNKKFLLNFEFKEVGRIPKWNKNKNQFIMFKKL